MRMMNIDGNSANEALSNDLESTKGEEIHRTLSPAVLTTTLIPFVLDGLKVVDPFHHSKNTTQHPSENLTEMDSYSIGKTTAFEGVQKEEAAKRSKAGTQIHTNTSNVSDIDYNTEEDVLYESVEDKIVQDDMSEEQNYLSRENTDGMNCKNSIKRNNCRNDTGPYVSNKN